MTIFLALIIWLVINYFTWWFSFNQNLCIVAGLFLIMPSLLKFHFKDLIYFKNHKFIFLTNLFFNFVLVPSIFLLVWYLFFWAKPIIFSFLLLWLIPGWWLLMSWIMNTKGNLKLGFSLFLVNLFIFSIIFIPFAKVLDTIWNKVKEEKTKQEQLIKKQNEKINSIINFWYTKNNNLNFLKQEKKVEKPAWCIISKLSKWLSCPVLWNIWVSKSAFIALFVLIFFPFIISRFILFSDKLTNFLLPKIKIISKIATFFIIAYIFSIKEVHNIFTTDFYIILKIFIWVLFAYLLVYLASYSAYKKFWRNPDSKSFFWNSITRFLTLWLIFSFFYIKTFWIEFLLVFVVAYFIQVIGSNIVFLRMNRKK